MRILYIFLATMATALGQFDLPTVIYGNVANEFNVIPNDGSASIVLFADGTEAGRAELNRHPTRDENYRIQISLSTGDPSPSFTVKLERTSGQTELMEVFTGVSTFTLVPGTATRYDFIEGEDTDSDGLADGWEELQFAAIGISEGDPGYDLSLLTPDGDYDFDGLSNREEFIAGTFATVFTSQVNFKTDSILADDWVSVSFDTEIGRKYQLLASTDGSQYAPVDMAVNDIRTNLLSTYTATSQGRVTVTTAPIAGAGVFYRIAVR